MALQILTWWLVVQALGLAGLPLAGLLFRSLPDGGYAFAKTLGLLLTGYGAWLLAMLGLGGFGAPLLILSALAVAGVGIWLRGGPRQLGDKARAAWGARRSAILAYEALFLAALVLMALMRAVDLDYFAPNPNPWHTERPMDYAFFNAIQRSAAFPPGDPWLSGFSINYYYFGYLLMAVVARLSGISGAAGYNLSLALIFALTALGVAGLIANLMLLAARPTTPDAPARRPSPAALVVVPLLGVLLVLVAGNLSGAVQLIVGSERAVALDSGQLISALSQSLRGQQRISLAEPALTADNDFGSVDGWERQDKAADFNWWWPSRSLWDEYPDQGGIRRYNITEFPFFSFWLGDMHPHVMALPFGLLALALALSALARPVAPAFAQGRSGWVELALVGIVLGSLYAINSWDLPTYLLLYAGALALLYLRLADNGPIFWADLARRLALATLAAFLLFAPFHLTFRSLVGSATPLIDLPLIGRLTSVIAPYTGERSGLHAFLIIFGLFAVPLVAFAYLASATREEQPATGEQFSILHLVLPWLPPALLLLGLLLSFPLLALVGLGLFAVAGAMRLAKHPAESFALLVIALGCAVIFGTELIYIRDVFSSRMNTIFKFYYQIWLIWGTLAPFALWWSLARARGIGRVIAFATTALFGLFLAGALVYPAINLQRLGQGQLAGLDGRTPREQSPAGLASIEWLRRNAAPGSVVLEAARVEDLAAQRCGGSYNGEGYAGVAAATGLPTVLGWVGHQSQWRGGDPEAQAEFGPRCVAVDTIYATPDPAAARELLERYDVDYVYIGGLERGLYAPESLAKFDAIGQRVFEQDEVTIYRLADESPGL